MPLPEPQPREHLHTRSVNYQGFRRADGLWDIDAVLVDTKTSLLHIPGEAAIPPGEPLHHLAIRVTIDAKFVVQSIAVAMDGVPHRECPKAQDPMQAMVGCTMGRGWRQAIERHLGGALGCAHLRELLFNMATVAFQTLSHELAHDNPDHPPPHFGKCLTWDFNGAVVQRLYPKFSGWPSTSKSNAPAGNKDEPQSSSGGVTERHQRCTGITTPPT